MNKKVIAFIPARGGSKGIPSKNIKIMVDKPLIYYVVKAALEVDIINNVVISTDDRLIKSTTEQYFTNSSKLIFFNRSPNTATDTATTESAMLDFVNRSTIEFDDIILIQATSPLLKSIHILEGYKSYKENKLGGLVSVVRQKRFIWSETEPLNYDPLNRPRRQNFEGYLVENGAFYITSRANLIKSGCRISRPYGVYEMPHETYYEIDEIKDWYVVEQLIKFDNK